MLIVAVPGLLLALILGSQIGQDSPLLAIIVAGGCVLFGIYVLFFQAVTFDALILGALIIGYVVGNRGFAQLHIGQNTPIYIGELGLTVCFALLGVRYALRRKKIIPKTALGWTIAVFLLLGGIRLSLDTFFQPSFDSAKTAIRDAATIYYALFFFITFQLGQNAVARRVLDRCILAGFIGLLPIAAIYIFGFNDVFNGIAIRGFPLIAHKGDLSSTFLACASFYFFLQPASGFRRVFFRGLSLLCFVAMIAWTARAALFGFGCAVVLLLVARQPRFVFYQAATVVAVLLFIGLLQFARISNTTALGRILDRVESITDISGKHNYRGDVGEASAQNNQFRLVWWESVISETVNKAPVFGLGFGYDLAKRFLLSYETPLNAFEFDTRSPHSVWVTIFGRMGVLGLICFGLIGFFIIRDAIRAGRQVARGNAEPVILSHWCAVLIILGSASFGVVLEGPMGGILFWSFLGLAASSVMQEQPKPSLAPTQKAAQVAMVH